jgi:uncharacterized protein
LGEGEVVSEFKLPFGKKTLNSYELILTEDCNLRCKYCFDDTYSDREGCNYNYTMPLSMVDDVLGFIEKTKDPYSRISVSFFGGEPTLNWEFIECFVEKSRDSHQFDYLINTNITTLNSEKIDYLLDNRVTIIASIDGKEESHDMKRIGKGGAGTWKLIMKRIPEILSKSRSRGVPFSILMVVTPETCHLMEENYRFLSSLMCTVNILYDFNREFTEGQFNLIEKQLRSMFIEDRVPLYYDIETRILSREFHSQDTFCHTANRVATISPNGGLFFCHRLTPKMSDELYSYNEERYGNIYDGYINTDYINMISDRVNREIFKIDKICEDCIALPFCKGGCIGAVRNGTGNYEDFLPTQCRINTILAKLFLKEEGGI